MTRTTVRARTAIGFPCCACLSLRLHSRWVSGMTAESETELLMDDPFAGISPISWLLIGELFPLEYRGIGSSIATSFSYFCAFLAVKTFVDFQVSAALTCSSPRFLMISLHTATARSRRSLLALRLHLLRRPVLRHHGCSRDKGQGPGGDGPKVHANDCHKSMRYGYTRRVSSIVFSETFKLFMETSSVRSFLIKNARQLS
jgi:hypothetical protein